MPEGGFFEEKRSSTTSLVVVVAAHAAAIAALALAKMDLPVIEMPGPITIRHVPLDPDPPPVPPEPKDQVEPQHRSTLTPPDRVVETKSDTAPQIPYQPPTQTVWSDTPIGVVERPKVEPLPPPPPPPQPLPEPVRIEARLKPGIELLPPYPPNEERAGAEGTVTVRLLIGPDGRVRSAEKVKAASEAFWRATERHALRAWRFTPATVDGKAVESSKVMTVRFKLEG